VEVVAEVGGGGEGVAVLSIGGLMGAETMSLG
jgi:hypothetical protein